MKKIVFLTPVLFLFSIGLLFAAGQGDSKSAAADATPEVVLAIGADPGDLAPFVGMSNGRITVLHTIYEYLFYLDKAGDPLSPYLAKDLEKIDDVTYHVFLYENIYDSAGNHITAEDAAWSYQTAMDMNYLRPVGDIESVSVVDEYTVEFVLKRKPLVGDLEKVLCEAPIVSKTAYEASSDKFAKNPVTSSPYKLSQYIPGSKLVFERRDDYWQKDLSLGPKYNRANIEKVVMQVITEPAQHSIALETKTVDISAMVTSDDVKNFEGRDGYSIFTFQDNLAVILQFNGKDGSPFASKELRQAMAYAIDSKAMCQAVAPGASTPLVTVGNSNFGGYQTKWENENYYAYDVARAKALAASAGVTPGTRIRLLQMNEPRYSLITQIIQYQLSEIGIQLEINQVEASVFNELKYDDSAWDIMLDTVAGGNFIFSPWLLAFDQTKNKGLTGGFVLDNKLQSLLTEASSTFTPESIDAFHKYQKDMNYAYGLLSFHNIVVAVEGVDKLVRDERNQIVPGSCEFSPEFK